MSKSQSLPKSHKLLHGREFERVFQARQKFVGRAIVIYVAPNRFNHGRLGLAISRKAGGAVARNRVKRWVREVFRRRQDSLRGVDFVVVARSSAAEAGANQISSDFARCVADLL